MKRSNFSRPPKNQTHPGTGGPISRFFTVTAAFVRPEHFFGNPTRSERESRQRCGGYSHERLRIELCRGQRFIECERLLNRVAQPLDQITETERSRLVDHGREWLALQVRRFQDKPTSVRVAPLSETQTFP